MFRIQRQLLIATSDADHTNHDIKLHGRVAYSDAAGLGAERDRLGSGDDDCEVGNGGREPYSLLYFIGFSDFLE